MYSCIGPLIFAEKFTLEAKLAFCMPLKFTSMLPSAVLVKN